ncbi:MULTISPECIES: c-type cytochrome biogenesis protein CcmI [unclassified Photorhabdus]|uniref:c-type cytochrome biogenesis protein CcmI n=1 Tax=unclassified Photorhabdus TaxID=2620880 RepID=UPI000DCBD00D|nr:MULTISPECIES: c-type cytochrome biogenesis protein CcmI [unclassified Photorhabdus]RAW99500.1 c-type cytochrome biogenesis protein CcmI [Photorhabdus sp. S10-54]RAW99606.1 c-type cytochrome biogenesis protein CcmI [Photorhabdus sp. S9-53]RAX03813.1 c-type cytochrome biogenesis protein CcmI [Photorhabdus sp. S8-52]
MIFWLIIIMLLASASALLVVPAILQGKANTNTNRDTLNKILYQEHLRELEQNEAQGVVNDRLALVQELQRNLLSDIPIQPIVQKKPINRWALVPGVLVLIIVAVGFYLKTGSLMQVLDWQNQEKQCESYQPTNTPRVCSHLPST